MLTEAFLKQAESCERLGSSFTARLLRLIAKKSPADGAVWQQIQNWPGDVTATGDAVALRLAASLHGLVLEGHSSKLKSVYPPHHQSATDDDIWQIVEAEISRNTDFVLERLKRPPQTNVIRRSAAILFGAGAAVRLSGVDKIKTFEVGASAGLNLHWDQNHYRIGDQAWGDPAADICLSPDCAASFPALPDFDVISRRGCDLTPLDTKDAKERWRLMSYIWPDQPDRLERAEKAIMRLIESGIDVEAADAVSWLQQNLTAPAEGSLRLVYHTVVAQYFPADIRAAFEACLKAAGEKATETSPLAWLSMETDGGIEGALLRLTLWPQGQVIDLARVDFHGRWISPLCEN